MGLVVVVATLIQVTPSSSQIDRRPTLVSRSLLEGVLDETSGSSLADVLGASGLAPPFPTKAGGLLRANLIA